MQQSQSTSNPTTATANYSYNIVTNGNNHVITYQPDKFGLGFFFLMFVPLAGVFLIIVPAMGWLIWLVLSCGIAYGIVYLKNLSRKPRSFEINATGFIVNNRSYRHEDINQVFFESSRKDKDIVTYTRPSVMQQLTQTSGKHHDKRSYVVGFRYGEQKVRVAEGLTENAAELLYQKVLNLTKGFSK